MSQKLIILKNQKFNRLTVLKETKPYINPSNKQNNRKFLCKCDCGSTISVLLQSLVRGTTKSCGCLQKERATQAQTKHGFSDTALYDKWRNMVNRCHNVKHPEYHNYGKRGIKVCRDWLGSKGLKKFVMWAKANGYADNLEIDREDNNKGYSPANCRFVTPKVNSNNKRNTIMICHESITYCFVDFWLKFRKSNVTLNAARRRYTHYNYTPIDAVTIPMLRQ